MGETRSRLMLAAIKSEPPRARQHVVGLGTCPTTGAGRGCDDVAKQPPSRKLTVGFVRLRVDSAGRWHARFDDPATGGDIRRILPVTTEGEAQQLAMEYNRAVMGARDMVPSWKRAEPRQAGLEVRKALVTAIRANGGQEQHKARQLKGANAFLAFLSQEFPSVTFWAEIRPSMFAAWIRQLQESERAFDTVRLLVCPVKAASKFWALEEPDLYRDWAKLARAKLQRTGRQPVAVLSPEQARVLLSWLSGNYRPLWPLAVLAGMAGLRELEAAAVRRADLDLEAGTVTVAKTARHTPKNRSSCRTVPLGAEAVEALRVYLDTCPVRDLDSEQPLFLSGAHKPWTLSALLQAWRRALRRAVPALGLPTAFKPRHLRATFATTARRGGADSRLLQAFLGHTRGDVLGEHYERIDVADLRKVVAAFGVAWNAPEGQKEGFRRQQTGNAENGVAQVVS